MAEFEPKAPVEAKEMFLAQRRDEVAEAMLRGYHYPLKPFLKWCEQKDVTNLNELRARSVHGYQLWRNQSKYKGVFPNKHYLAKNNNTIIDVCGRVESDSISKLRLKFRNRCHDLRIGD
jgi:hypothetical protein